MTYFEFHLVFLLPPLALLAGRWLRSGGSGTRRESFHVLLLATIALAWTTPWDNYLVWKGIWSYGPDRVVGTVGYVPVEEYLFFLLQPVLLGLLYLEIERRLPARGAGSARVRWAGTLFWLAAAVAGGSLLRVPSGTYMGLILVWAGPVLAGQWAWAGSEIAAWRFPAGATVAAGSLYLWIADRIAIGLGIWEISPDFTTGLKIIGLPVEEAAFFLLTSLLVVQGLVLFRHPPGRAGDRPGRGERGDSGA